MWTTADVFDIHGNHLRLIVKRTFERERIFIKSILTHAAYAKEAWFEHCRCTHLWPLHNYLYAHYLSLSWHRHRDVF